MRQTAAVDLTVRRTTLDDIEETLDVYEAIAAEGRWIGGEAPINREAVRPRRIASLERDDHLSLVATVDDRIVGQLTLDGRDRRLVAGHGDPGLAPGAGDR